MLRPNDTRLSKEIFRISKCVVGRRLDEELIQRGDQGTKLLSPETVLACLHQYDSVVSRIHLEVVGVQRSEVLDVVRHYRTPVAGRRRQYLPISDSSQPRLGGGHNVMATGPQLRDYRWRQLLVKEQPQARLIACWRSNAAAASAIMMRLASIHSSIASRLSA